MKHMKTKIIFTLLLVVSFLTVSFNLSAQQSTDERVNYSGKSDKFAIMVSDIPHFQTAIRTIQLMDVKEKNFTFEVVVGGKLAKEIAENVELKIEIDKSQKIGIKIVVCEGAMAIHGVSKDMLDKRLFTTRNALIYMFELQDKGYNTLVY